MTTYYVHKGVGSDSNNGLSWANCFNSLNKAKNTAGNNDTIYVRSGVYQEQLILNKNGQRWLADAGHQPSIDGKYHDQLGDFNLANVPVGTYVVQKTEKGSQPPLVGIGGDDNEFTGFAIRNGAGNGLAITGKSNHAHHLHIDFHYGNAIIINGTGDRTNCRDNVVEDSETSRGGILRFARKDREVWARKEDGSLAGYFIVCNAMKNCSNNIFRRLICHHQNGEALVLGKDSEYCIIEECTVWNNYHMNLYMNNTRSGIMRWNISFVSWNDDMLRGEKEGKDPWPTECIVIGDEEAGGTYSRYNQVYGNLFVGGKAVIGQRNGGNYDTVLRDFYFGYNTCVGRVGVTKNISSVGPSKLGEPHTNCLFENNILYHSGAFELNGKFFLSNTAPGVTGRGNLVFWEGHPDLSVPSFVGSAIKADPTLVNPKAAIIDYAGNGDNPKLGTTGKGPNEGNNFNKNNYLLTGSSPAINAAAVGYPFGGHNGVPLAAQRDCFGATRNDPDIGFHEYGGTVTNSVTAAFTRNPAATTIAEGTAVTFTNTSFTTGSATITGQTWTVKKAGTTVLTATSTNLSYTFATDGSYTVELVVTASGGLSDSEIITITVTDASGGVVVTAAFTASPSQTTVQQGAVVTFTDASTVQNGSIGSRLWEVLVLPGGTTVVATGTGATFQHTFATDGGFRVRLTATATTGQSDTEQRDYTVNAVTTPTVDAAFTASDADGIIPEGGTIDFTNASTATGTTLSGYLWTIERQGAGSEATYTTTDISHTFAQAGLYTVTLRADTAAGISDTASMTITVQAQTTEGREVMIVPVQFAVATTTGAQTVTAAALGTKVPKGVHLRLIGATAAGTAAAGALWSEGAASGAGQWVHCRFSAAGTGGGTARRRYATNAIAMTIDAAGAKTGQASFVRFVPGGMEINVTDAFPAAYLAEAVFYAGDTCQFWTGNTIIGAKDTARSVTTNIDQDAVYLMSTWAAQEDTADAHADYSRGWALRDETQLHLRNRDFDGAAPTTNLVTRLQPRIGSSGDGIPGYATIQASGFRHDGFNLTVLGSDLPRTASMFAFRAGGYGVHLGLLEVPASDTLAFTLPFEAQTVQALTSSFGLATTNPSGQLSGLDAEGQGWYSLSLHGPASWSGSIASEDGAETTATWSMGAAGFRAVNHAGGDLWAGAASISGAVLTVAPTTYPAKPCRMIVLSVEQAEEVVDPGEEPTADFTYTSDVDPETGAVAIWFDGSLSNGNGEEITAYAWDFDDGATSTEVKPLHVYATEGSYAVSLTVTTVAGSDTKTTNVIILPAPPIQAPRLVGPIDPETCTGDTPNAIDEETATHTHLVLFDPVARFRPMTDQEFADFQASEPDPEHVQMGFYPNKFVIKYPDGTIRYIYPTTLPPPGTG